MTSWHLRRLSLCNIILQPLEDDLSILFVTTNSSIQSRSIVLGSDIIIISNNLIQEREETGVVPSAADGLKHDDIF